MEKKIFTPLELSKMLGVSVHTIATWRRKDRGPKFTRRGYKEVFYRLEDIQRFADEFNYTLPK